MDIRGFGNLVGEEQSGHIREVGIELYQQMLEEAVAALKKVASDSGLVTGGKESSSHQPPATSHADWSPQINLGISVQIPESYVADLQLRLGLYRRIAEMINESDIDSFAAELVDRFGDMPDEVKHLIATLSIKLLCKKASIDRLDAGPKGAVISFRNNLFSHPEALLAYVDKNLRSLKVRPDQRLIFSHEWKDLDDKILTIKKLTADIAEMAK